MYALSKSLVPSALLITSKRLKLTSYNTPGSLSIIIVEEGAWALPGAVTFGQEGWLSAYGLQFLFLLSSSPFFGEEYFDCRGYLAHKHLEPPPPPFEEVLHPGKREVFPTGVGNGSP